MNFLLLIHIVAGTVALFCMLVALMLKKGGEGHMLSGKVYFWSMVFIFITAVFMSVFKANTFLLLIALFSFYQAFSGLRFAKNREGVASTLDWIAISIMIASGLGMWVLAIFYYINDNSHYITLLVLGTVAIFLGYSDFRDYRNNEVIGKKRIAKHLTNMMGGGIAVITAVLIVNVDFQPAWVMWVLPTIIVTPFIIWQRKRVLKS